MTIRYDLAMHHAYAGRQYGCVDTTYEGINWFEDEPKPTREELEGIWETIKDAEAARERNTLRSMAYPTTDELVVALWEKFVENRSDAAEKIAELQERRLAVKAQFPKG